MNTQDIIDKVVYNNSLCGKAEERKLYGEVMTPISLADEMLDQLPEEVWTNPDLKWLDPANGCGIFPAVIVQRLMKGLAGKIPDEEERYKHIVEKMLHVCELQPKNMFLFLCAFDPKDKYAMNIFTGSFLTEDFNRHAKELWNVEKFDVIVGNPPYQKDSENGKQSHAIWHLFVLKALHLTKNKGYLTTVHPSGWRNPSGAFKEVQNSLRKTQMLALSINDEKVGIKTFGAETRFDFYTTQINTNSGKTRVKTQNGETISVNLTEVEFIPNSHFNEFKKLLAKQGEERTEVIYSRSAYGTDKSHISKTKSSTFTWPCVYIVNAKHEPSIRWSNTNENGHFNIPKLIWTNGRTASLGSIIDEKGTYGLTQFAYAICEKPENLKKLKQAFDSKDFRNLMEHCALNHDINWKIIALFRRDFWKEFID